MSDFEETDWMSFFDQSVNNVYINFTNYITNKLAID